MRSTFLGRWQRGGLLQRGIRSRWPDRRANQNICGGAPGRGLSRRIVCLSKSMGKLGRQD